MQKIAIIGSGGAGKSTLSRTLGAILDIPVYHLDAIFWQPGWKPLGREALINKHQEIFTQDTWIIDGNFGSTMDLRLQEADTVIFLHYKTIRCLYRIIKRRIQFHSKTRPDMGEGCPEKLDWEFFRWVQQYNKNNAPSILKRLATLSHKNIYVFNRPSELNKFLNNLREHSEKN
ncbi:DNA topology modulation protein [Ornithinibacillus salinisoli]|uniref:DNA topology modulation protein n=1 Tax=Ornithinibacillus salinisoli TaxID=1848459 RepID=A0ABW4VVY6_9BACI